MHVGILAQESTTIASALSLVFSCLLAYAFVIGFRNQWLLWLSLGFAGLCIYFGLLSISAGPKPILNRGDIARTARIVLIISYGFLGIGFLRVGRRVWRSTGQCDRPN